MPHIHMPKTSVLSAYALDRHIAIAPSGPNYNALFIQAEKSMAIAGDYA